MTIDIQALKEGQKITWGSAGDYTQIGKLIAYESELLCEAVSVQANHRVIDVATGTGNTALAAARRCSGGRQQSNVVGLDFADDLIGIARNRAAAEGLGVTFEIGDAAELPYQDNSFDIVLSTFGIMFVPDQDKVANELIRVCKPGGRIGLASWTPDGLVGQLQRTVGSFAPPPQGVQSPVLWGTEGRLHELMGEHVDLSFEHRDAIFHFTSSDEFVDAQCKYYGPVIKALERLDEPDQQQMISQLKRVVSDYSTEVDGGTELRASYLQVVGTVRS